MSAERRRSSALSAARYSPFSRILSPVYSLTRLIRRTYQSEREAIGSPVDSTPAPSVAAGSSDLGGINQCGPIPALNGHSHSASHGSNAMVPFRFWNPIESEGNESDSDYVPPARSESSVLTEMFSTTTETSDPSTGVVARTSVSMVPRSCASPRQLCVNWTEQTRHHSELEPGEILEIPEVGRRLSVLDLLSDSEPPSELAVPYLARPPRSYEFGDSFIGGRLKFDPPLPGPPSINRWMYHPRTLARMADTERAIGDIDFNPALGDGFEYYVYCEAPGCNDHIYTWLSRQVGDSHPLLPNYVLHHYPDRAPVWLYQPWRETL
ncbi:hypothetical protein FRC12_000662 [Ceratobasidium sp. 428]|nr:hypothetical protein FRC12_000662 [Ceratobasidium sp. 428]